MKYKIAFSALLAATLLGASENNYEISAMGGYTIPNDGQKLNDYGTYGVEMQLNAFESAIKPELSVFYSNANYKYDNGSTKLLRAALNGVYSFDRTGEMTPFFKVGAGYESMSKNAFGNHDGVFADAGVGIKLDLTQQLAFKLEAIKMLKSNSGSFDNNLLLLAGLTFSFDKKTDESVATSSEPEPTPEIASAVVVEKSVVSTTVTEKVTVVAPIDSDNDGVVDPNDQCPDTAAGLKVDETGCPLKATINDHFVFNSDHIDSTAASEIRAFVVFMKENPRYKATITGHTDSIGTTEYNQKLSIKRAEKVKEALVSQGIEPERLSVVGKGESMPIMSNMLKAGRAENRRIEVDIHE